ncbi:MAG: phosphotriesterase, partial [Actinobacteria bacterium]|nr:phosphotriesterase [Actinomycetota bacterium]
ARVQIAHTGDTDDLDYIESVLERGVFIGMDRYGLDMFLPTDRRNATVAELLRRGHADRMFISQDFCGTIDWFPPEGVEMLVNGGLVREDWSMTLIFEEVLPALREEEALTDEHYQTMFVDNARRWLTGA